MPENTKTLSSFISSAAAFNNIDSQAHNFLQRYSSATVERRYLLLNMGLSFKLG